MPDLNSVGESVEVRSHLPGTPFRSAQKKGTSMVKRHIIPSHTTELSMLVYSFYIYIMIQNMQISELSQYITIYHNACLHMRQEEDQTGILWATRLFNDCARIFCEIWTWDPCSRLSFRSGTVSFQAHYNPCGKTNNKPTVWEWSVPPMVMFGIFLHWHLHKKRNVYCVYIYVCIYICVCVYNMYIICI